MGSITSVYDKDHKLAQTPADGHTQLELSRSLIVAFLQVNCSNLVSWVLAHAEVNISVLECEEPEVQVQAPRLSIWRFQATQVEASVDLKGCVRYGAQYLWQILAAPSCGDEEEDGAEHRALQTAPAAPVVPLPPEVDVQRLQLSLPKMVLPAGKYTLVFSLSYENVPLRKAACLQLTVMAARSVHRRPASGSQSSASVTVFRISQAQRLAALPSPLELRENIVAQNWSWKNLNFSRVQFWLIRCS